MLYAGILRGLCINPTTVNNNISIWNQPEPVYNWNGTATACSFIVRCYIFIHNQYQYDYIQPEVKTFTILTEIIAEYCLNYVFWHIMASEKNEYV